MAEKKVRIANERMYKPNPGNPDSGVNSKQSNKPNVGSINTGGRGDDTCGNSPRFPKDPRFKETLKERIQQVQNQKEHIARDNMKINVEKVIKK